MADTRDLPVKLNDDEVLLRADEAAKTTRAMYEAEQRRKDVGKALKEEVDDLQAKLKKLARIVETRTEDRPVEVEWERDDRRMMMTLVRRDTGQVVETRAMNSEELAQRQVDLFAVDGGKGKKKPDAS